MSTNAADRLFGEWQPWADPEVVAVRRLPMRPPHVAYPSFEEARTFDRRMSPWWMSLDGKWMARRWPHPCEVPLVALTESTAGWASVHVPGNWTMQGLVDLPHYTNIAMPWKGVPPSLPDELATVVYRRSFVAPADWIGRRLILHVGGAESAHGLWVNGRFVGWGTDSRVASEYDVSAHVTAGSNEVAIAVCRYSAQSYLEDQDQWWMAGLHREVFIEARAPVAIDAAYLNPTIDTSTVRGLTARGRVGLRVRVASTDGSSIGPGWRVRWRLIDPDGDAAGDARVVDVPHDTTPYIFGGHEARDDFSPGRVRSWSAESPSLYVVHLTLINPRGDEVEHMATRIGFRKVEVRDRSLLINGERVIIRGVNRHDHSPTNGKAVTTEEMRADLVAMKRHNINAVRCSHYPNDPRLLDMCDELGLYVVDEANAEAHAFNTSLWRDARWHGSWMARVTRMVERDLNHPSVILWSLGNEAGYGPIHDAVAAAVRAMDSSRPLHYEPAIFHTNWVDGGRAATDVVCPMYSPLDAVIAYGKSGRGDRPLIMCEFSHAMGNSNGSLSDYVKAFETIPGLQGGFVWEWKDHALRQLLPRGGKRLAYGGQFGDSPNDSNFVADGLMHADMSPHPAMRELMWVHRPVATCIRGTGSKRRLVVTNRRHFLGIEDLVGEWSLNVDGITTSAGAVKARPAAGEQVEVALPCEVPSRGEVHLIVRWRTRLATPWCEAGHEAAWDCHDLTPRRRSTMVQSLSVETNEVASTISPLLTLWRAPTDNDGMKLAPHMWPMFGKSLGRWLDQGIDKVPADDLVGHRHHRETRDDGSVIHRHVVTVPRSLEDLPRVGVRFELPAGYDRIRWFGDGPHECYPDRRASAITAIWESAPDELPYLVPQEFGLRTNCRWMEFFSSLNDGRVIRVAALGGTLHMSAIHHTPQDLHSACEVGDLVRRDRLTVHLDVAHRGLGTASCGPDTLPGYRIASGRYEFSYVVTSGR